jgi:Tfp pilus assembly protein PilO
MIRRLGIGALGGVLLLAVVWYGVFWGPESSRLKAAQKQQSQVESNIETLTAQIAGLRAQQRQLPGDREALAQLNNAVPEGPSLDQLLTSITAAAAAAHVGLESIGTPAPAGWGTTAAAAAAAVASPSITLSIGINATGSSQVLAFVSALESQPRLYVVDSFEIANVSAASVRTSSAPAPKLHGLKGTSGKSAESSSAGQSTSLLVQAFYVTASSNDPASLNVSFGAAPTSKRPSKTEPASVGVSQENARAEAAAIKVVLSEKTYEAANGMYLASGTDKAAKLLGDVSDLAGTAGPVTAGLVAARAGKVSGDEFTADAPGGTGHGVVVESLSASGTCFYIASPSVGTPSVEGFAETTDGCTANIAFPVGTPKAPPSGRWTVPSSSAGLTSFSWFSSW